MTISALGGTNTQNALGPNSLGLQDFLKVLLTQLSYQDPLKPMDNQQFMAQIAQLTALEQTQQLNSKVDQLLANQASLQSVGLIGRTVDVGTANGVATGTVTALALNGDVPQLTISTTDGRTLAGIGLDQITTVR